MQPTPPNADQEKQPSTVYTYDIEYDYHYGGCQKTYELVVDDRSWFKLDRKPFEYRYPESLPHFLYRFEWQAPYLFENIEAAVKRGAKLKALAKMPGCVQVIDKSYLFRNLARSLRAKKERLFRYLPVTFSFAIGEMQLHRDMQRFCRIFMAIVNKTTPDKIEPLRVEVDDQTKERIPIFYEFKHAKFPKGSIVDRKGFENPDWDELDFEDTFFGEGTNKWLLKAGNAERGAAIEFFSSLEELDKFLSLFLSGYDYCYFKYTNYGPDNTGSPTLIPGIKPSEKVEKKIFPTFIIQKYMEKPQLIEGYKHTVRVYTLYTQEVKGYVFEEWYTGLCGMKYDVKSTNHITHLTGMDLSSKLPETVESASMHCLSKKDTLKYAKVSDEQNKHLAKMIFESVIVDGVNILNPTRISGAFEMYGIDILYDANDKAWLIEFNEDCDIYGQGDPYYDPYANRLVEDYFQLTIDKILPRPPNGVRLGRDFSFLDYPKDLNLWTEVVDNSNRIK